MPEWRFWILVLSSLVTRKRKTSPEVAVGVVIPPDPLDEDHLLPEEVLCRRHRLPRPLEPVRVRLLRHRSRHHRRPRHRRRLLPREGVGRQRRRHRHRRGRRPRQERGGRRVEGVAALAPVQLLVAVRALQLVRRRGRDGIGRGRRGLRLRGGRPLLLLLLVLLVLHHLDALDGRLVELREGRGAELERRPEVSLLLRRLEALELVIRCQEWEGIAIDRAAGLA